MHGERRGASNGNKDLKIKGEDMLGKSRMSGECIQGHRHRLTVFRESVLTNEGAKDEWGPRKGWFVTQNDELSAIVGVEQSKGLGLPVDAGFKRQGCHSTRDKNGAQRDRKKKRGNRNIKEERTTGSRSRTLKACEGTCVERVLCAGQVCSLIDRRKEFGSSRGFRF
jgi:hypothetical protein